MSLPTFLVEDNVLIQTNLIAALEELAGARIVGVAPSETRAVDWLQGHPGDWKLAVVDLFLAQGTGLGVVDCCRRRGGDQRVVVEVRIPKVNTDEARKAVEKLADQLDARAYKEDEGFFDRLKSAFR